MHAAHHYQGLAHSPARGHQGSPPPSDPNGQYDQPSPPYTAIGSNYTTSNHFELSAVKRRRTSRRDGFPTSTPAANISLARAHPARPSSAGRQPEQAKRKKAPLSGPAIKSRRVRTGCLTCRERHLKCDEAIPDCLNCRKSNRECKRGLRLNFIDIQCKRPPYLTPTNEWSVQFQDESRLVASEYRGGLSRYPRPLTPPGEAEVDSVLRQHQPTDQSDEHGTLSAGPSRHPDPSRAQKLYYPDSGAWRQSQDQAEFGITHPREDHGRLSRHASDDYPSTTTPPASHDDPSACHIRANRPKPFSLTSLHGHFGQGKDDGRDDGAHGSRSSDVSSVTSSLVPQVAGPTTQLIGDGPRQAPTQADGSPEAMLSPLREKTTGSEKESLDSDEEIRFMHVFVQKVAIWMDSFDKDKHFGQVIPYLALKSPMLLNAFLACGVKYLALVEDYQDEKALFYYDTATTQLLQNLRNPDRNATECATTAVVLNVYEIMSEKPSARMSHIAGARALLRECGWNAKSTGVGSACFWLNIGMEVLSCLAFNWQTAWDPDQWGLDLDFTTWRIGDCTGGHGPGPCQREARCSTPQNSSSRIGYGDEDVWVHRIFYIVAKIANFRANMPKFQEPSPHDEQVRLQGRFAEWERLKGMCDVWNYHCPRCMRPFGYSPVSSATSVFPHVWLIKRAAVIGRLFYHTAMCLLMQNNPLTPRESDENRTAQLHHAHQVCGIVAHTTDRGVASVAIRSVAIASAILTDRTEQDEILGILTRINKDTGWRLEKVFVELQRAWGWTQPVRMTPLPALAGCRGLYLGNLAMDTGSGSEKTVPQSYPPQQRLHQQPHHPTGRASIASSAHVAAPVPTRPKVNPLLVQADFNLPNHPYQNWYEPPNRSTFTSHGFWSA